MARKHYHVGANTPGYLPESDPVIFSNRRDAERAAAGLKNDYLEDNYIFPGEVHYTATGSARSGEIYITNTRNEHDLGTVIWIYECTEDTCNESEDN